MDCCATAAGTDEPNVGSTWHDSEGAAMTPKRVWFIGLLLSLVLPRSAFAHGGGPGLDYDPCAQQVGDDYIHMAAISRN